jgi:hypothetical protein
MKTYEIQGGFGRNHLNNLTTAPVRSSRYPTPLARLSPWGGSVQA